MLHNHVPGGHYIDAINSINMVKCMKGQYTPTCKETMLQKIHDAGPCKEKGKMPYKTFHFHM